MSLQGLEKSYQLIPMKDITDEAREIAVRWMECDDKNWIENKHKLASDLMNYARRHREVSGVVPEDIKEELREITRYFKRGVSEQHYNDGYLKLLELVKKLV